MLLKKPALLFMDEVHHLPFTSCIILAHHATQHTDASAPASTPTPPSPLQATAALDEATEAHFHHVLEQQLQASTIVCIAHRLESLRWCHTRVEMGQVSVCECVCVCECVSVCECVCVCVCV